MPLLKKVTMQIFCVKFSKRDRKMRESLLSLSTKYGGNYGGIVKDKSKPNKCNLIILIILYIIKL